LANVDGDPADIGAAELDFTGAGAGVDDDLGAQPGGAC
jgi:hypothetical protein